MDIITEVKLWEIVKHLSRWLVNLGRAGDTRKRQSIEALRQVIVAARETRVYLRQLEHNGKQDHGKEAELAVKWTQLSFKLKDLGLKKLSKRCDIKGQYWADPGQFEAAYLEKADVALDRMEYLARQMLAEVSV